MTDVYEEIKNHFDNVDEVTVNHGKGAQGMKIGKKMFAMFGGGNLILYFPPDRALEIVESGEGEPHVLSNGMTMKSQVVIPVKNKNKWIEFAEEAQRLFNRK